MFDSYLLRNKDHVAQVQMQCNAMPSYDIDLL